MIGYLGACGGLAEPPDPETILGWLQPAEEVVVTPQTAARVKGEVQQAAAAFAAFGKR